MSVPTGSRNPSTVTLISQKAHPEDLERRLVAPLQDALRKAGRVPHAYTIEDLRTAPDWLTRASHDPDAPGRLVWIYRELEALLDRIRYPLPKRAPFLHSTPVDRQHRCPGVAPDTQPTRPTARTALQRQWARVRTRLASRGRRPQQLATCAPLTRL